MTFDDIFIEIFIEKPVDRVKDLRFADTAISPAGKKFEYPSLAAGQRQHIASNERITTVAKHLDIPDLGRILNVPAAASGGPNAGQDLAGMNWFADDVVDTGSEKIQRLIK